MTWWPRRRRKKSSIPQARTSTPLPEQTQRRYLKDAEYPLPKDEGERSRLDFQHRALYLTLGNHYVAPLPPRVLTILDVGTGTGIWACDMARTFPEALVLGLDLDPELFNQTPPHNCLLREGNVLQGLPLPDAMFEYTHQRFLVLAIPDSRWPGVVQELVRVTRVGGWLELVETDARVQAGGQATERMFGWIEAVRVARGVRGQQVMRLRELLRAAGVEEVEEQKIVLKIGAWGGRAGGIMEQDVLAAVQALQEPCCALGVDAQEFEECGREMAREWRTARAFCTVYVAYGRRAR